MKNALSLLLPPLVAVLATGCTAQTVPIAALTARQTAPVAATTATVASSVTITVAPVARQTFRGFGASLGSWGGEYRALSPTDRALLSRSLWRDLKFDTLRLWFNTGKYAPTCGAQDLSEFRKCYVDSGLIADARKKGVTTLLMAPDGLPDYMRSDGSGSAQSGRALKESETENYAVLVAEFIQQFKQKTGIALHVTGVQDEPNNEDRFTPAQIVRVTKRLWSELDARGLQSVGIITPEEPGNALRAASLASRFLNDMNHGVTHWIHFIGFDIADPKDNATRIFAYTASPFRLIRYRKQAYYQQLSQTFDVGAVFRQSSSDREGDMTYTYGKKPRITAAAAWNPDGTWGIGLSNFTSPTFVDAEDPKDFDKHNSGHSAQTFAVTVRIPELAARKSVTFRVHHSSGTISDAPAGNVIMQNGVVTIPGVRARPGDQTLYGNKGFHRIMSNDSVSARTLPPQRHFLHR